MASVGRQLRYQLQLRVHSPEYGPVKQQLTAHYTVPTPAVADILGTATSTATTNIVATKHSCFHAQHFATGTSTAHIVVKLVVILQVVATNPLDTTAVAGAEQPELVELGQQLHQVTPDSIELHTLLSSWHIDH